MTCSHGDKRISPLTVRQLMVAALAVILITALGSVAHAQVESCNVPDGITVSGFRIEAVSSEVQLDPIDFPTTLRWAFALLLPDLAKDEIGIFLYDPESLLKSKIGLDDRHVLLFIVCNRGESYWARLGAISPLNPQQESGINSHQESDITDDGVLYLGTTIPFPRSSSGLTASEIMRGDLRSFSPLSGMEDP